MKAIIDRLVADAKVLQQQGVNVVAISSNDYSRVPEDSPEMMARFAADHDFSFEYLVDRDQSVARDYGAVCTPDFFGFNSVGVRVASRKLEVVSRK
ncbi:MAG: redoxin domain-containing protein [Pseudomonadales bacterium]|nr:redoxin domain-containing protein [Pseudomonadales bacterium]